jgi:transcriptional regulator with XRE-family HTH domain
MINRNNPRRTNDSHIARMRIDLGLTQAQLAEKVGCYPKDISRWETGVRNPGAKSLMALAKALGCSIEDLIQ